MKMENINPDHYRNNGKDLFAHFEEGLMTPNEIVGFYKGNIMKYLTRYQDKNGIEDLKKCERYLKQLISYEEKQDV